MGRGISVLKQDYELVSLFIISLDFSAVYRYYKFNPLAQFIALLGFYNQQDVAAVRDKYEEYYKTVVKSYEYSL